MSRVPEELSPTPALEEEETQEQVFKGIAVAPGIVIGPAYVYARAVFDVEKRRLSDGEVEGEVERFVWAVARSEHNLRKIRDLAREKLGEQNAGIFEAQLLMLRDKALYEAVVEHIRKDRFNADYAVMTVMASHRQRMETSDNDYLRERANDLQDVEDRLIMHLRRGKHLSAIEPETIVIAENLTAADLLLFTRRGILGCAMDHGGPTSHVSIMARALGLPAVVSLHGATTSVETGDQVIIDGLSGKVIIHPAPETLKEYRSRSKRYQRFVREHKALAPLPAVTLDGRRIKLQANLEFMEETDVLKEYGAEGIGLMRTEMVLFMKGNLSMDEDQQVEIYRNVIEAASPGITTFRLLDLGGDKMLPVAHREHNPFLGWRGIRVLLDKPDILIPQLRALLRASTAGPMRILVPMVSSMSEMNRLRAFLDETHDALVQEGHDIVRDIPLGIMVEVPAVALTASSYAPFVDFFSLGTNDLTQYTLAVDRGNDLVAGLYRELHPAVLNLIHRTIQAGHTEGIPVGLCGQLGANPMAVPLLVGLGLDEISASPSYLPEVKRVIRAIDYEEAQELARQALTASGADEVAQLLDAWLVEHACEPLQFF